MPREATPTTTLTVQGIEIPKLGLGTWQIAGRAGEVAVRDAFEPYLAQAEVLALARGRAANLDVFDCELSDDEREAIAGLARGRRTIAPSWALDWD